VRLYGIIIFSFPVQTFQTKNFEKMIKKESVNYVMNYKHHATLCLAEGEEVMYVSLFDCAPLSP
jgi:hypothetical protein